MGDIKAVQRWRSDRMEQDITLARWGHEGVPVLAFPTAGGDSEEVERHKLVDHLRPMIDAGRVKVYSCDSVAGRAMAAHHGDPAYRCWLFNQFHLAVANEVVPAIHADCGPQGVIVTGSSIGAFNALGLLCRYPELFRAAVCMSGTYDIERFVGGYTDDLFYASAVRFLPGLEGPVLDALRQRLVILASGSGRWEDPDESWRVADLLGVKGIPNRVDDWGQGYDHDWPTWWQMLPTYLDQLT